MATTNDVIAFIKSKGVDGATLSEIQRRICELNHRDFDAKDASGQRINRGYWTVRLYGGPTRRGLLETYCQKVGRKYVLKDIAAVAPTLNALQDLGKKDTTEYLDPADVRTDTFSVGAGGWIQRSIVGVRITHIPTGIVAECSDDRSVHRNKAVAYEKLYRLVADAKKNGTVKPQMTIKVS